MNFMKISRIIYASHQEIAKCELNILSKATVDYLKNISDSVGGRIDYTTDIENRLKQYQTIIENSSEKCEINKLTNKAVKSVDLNDYQGMTDDEYILLNALFKLNYLMGKQDEEVI